MDDFLAYFLAGMFGEELMRKISTRPFGFWVLWLIGFVLVNVLLIVLLVSLAVMGYLTVGLQPGETLLSVVHAGLIFFFVWIQPWATLMALGMGFLLAVSYRWHYRDKQKRPEDRNEKNGSFDR